MNRNRALKLVGITEEEYISWCRYFQLDYRKPHVLKKFLGRVRNNKINRVVKLNYLLDEGKRFY